MLVRYGGVAIEGGSYRVVRFANADACFGCLALGIFDKAPRKRRRLYPTITSNIAPNLFYRETRLALIME